MKFIVFALAGSALAMTSVTANAAPAVAAVAPAEEWPEAWFEIFKLAPGKQEEFIRKIAQADEVSAIAGQPPIQLFFHQDGADFDVILFKPVTDFKATPEQEAAMARKRKELGLPSGPAYYLGIRELIASHTDSKTTGPVSAGSWLGRLDAWRAEHPPREQARK